MQVVNFLIINYFLVCFWQ